MTNKTRHLGRESGKSSSRWFGPAGPPGSAAAQHGNGARAGDGRTSNPSLLGKIAVIFKGEAKKK